MPEETLSALGACKRFECQVIGLPRPSVRWYKDGVNITTRPRYKFEYTPDGCVILVLKNVTRDDQGIYSCRAQNSEGSAETTAQLYVKGVISNADEEEVSTHMMSFHKITDDTALMTSSSQRRPLHIGDRNRDAESDTSEDSVLCMESEFSMQSEENAGVLTEERLEHVRYGETYRRVTTDSGITSRGSSFSSEHDLNIDGSKMQGMKEYLHGKGAADFLEKLEKGIAAGRAEGKEYDIDWDRVNEFDARLLAGKFLFDKGPGEQDAEETRYHLTICEMINQTEDPQFLADFLAASRRVDNEENVISGKVSVQKSQTEYRAVESKATTDRDTSVALQEVVDKQSDTLLQTETTSLERKASKSKSILVSNIEESMISTDKENMLEMITTADALKASTGSDTGVVLQKTITTKDEGILQTEISSVEQKTSKSESRLVSNIEESVISIDKEKLSEILTTKSDLVSKEMKSNKDVLEAVEVSVTEKQEVKKIEQQQTDKHRTGEDNTDGDSKPMNDLDSQKNITVDSMHSGKQNEEESKSDENTDLGKDTTKVITNDNIKSEKDISAFNMEVKGDVKCDSEIFDTSDKTIIRTSSDISESSTNINSDRLVIDTVMVTEETALESEHKSNDNTKDASSNLKDGAKDVGNNGNVECNYEETNKVNQPTVDVESTMSTTTEVQPKQSDIKLSTDTENMTFKDDANQSKSMENGQGNVFERPTVENSDMKNDKTNLSTANIEPVAKGNDLLNSQCITETEKTDIKSLVFSSENLHRDATNINTNNERDDIDTRLADEHEKDSKTNIPKENMKDDMTNDATSNMQSESEPGIINHVDKPLGIPTENVDGNLSKNDVTNRSSDNETIHQKEMTSEANMIQLTQKSRTEQTFETPKVVTSQMDEQQEMQSKITPAYETVALHQTTEIVSVKDLEIADELKGSPNTKKSAVQDSQDTSVKPNISTVDSMTAELNDSTKLENISGINATKIPSENSAALQDSSKYQSSTATEITDSQHDLKYADISDSKLKDTANDMITTKTGLSQTIEYQDKQILDIEVKTEQISIRTQRNEQSNMPENGTHHGKMQRQEEHPGLLDHDLRDDAESRAMAGKYLFNEADVMEPDDHEIAHEILYMYKADKAEGSTPDPLLLETVLKEISSSTEHYQFETGVKSEKISVTDASIDSMTANASKEDGLVANVTSSEIARTDYLEETTKATTSAVECKAVESVDGLGISKHASTDASASSQSKSTPLEETVTEDTVTELQSSMDSITNSIKTENDVSETTVATDSPKENIVNAVTADVIEESETLRDLAQKSETEKAETKMIDKFETNICVKKNDLLESNVKRVSGDLTEQAELSESELKPEAITPTKLDQESTGSANISAKIEETRIDKNLESTEIIEMADNDTSTVTCKPDDIVETLVTETKEKAVLHRTASHAEEALQGQQEVTGADQEDMVTIDGDSDIQYETVKSDTIQSLDNAIKENPVLRRMESRAEEVVDNMSSETEQVSRTIASENNQETVATVDHESSVNYETIYDKDSGHERVEILEAAEKDEAQSTPDKTSTEICKVDDVTAEETNLNKKKETLSEEQTDFNETSKLNDTAIETLQSQPVDSEIIPDTAVATENSLESAEDSQAKDKYLVTVTDKNAASADEKDVIVNEKGVATITEQDIAAVNEKDAVLANDEVIVSVNENDLASANEKDITTVKEQYVASSNEKDTVPLNEKDIASANEKNTLPMNEKDVASSNKNDIAPVSEIELVNDKVVESVNKKDITSVNEKAIASVNEKAISSVNEKDGASANENDIAAVSEKDIVSLNKKDVASVNEKDIKPVNETDVASVNKKDIAASSEKAIASVNEKHVASVNKKDIKPVNEKDVASVNKKDIAASNDKSAVAVNEKVAASASKTDVEPVNEKDVVSVNKKDVASVNDKTVAVVNKKDVASASKKDIEPVNGKDVASVNKKDVAPVNDKAVAVVKDVAASSGDKPDRDRPGINVEVLMASSDVFVKQGEDIALQWKITGIDLSSVGVFKDGFKLLQDDRVKLEVAGDICTLAVNKAIVDDDATYSVRVDNSNVDEGSITVNIIVSASAIASRDAPEEPGFVIKPTVEVIDGRRLSLKCSVSGFPAPEVTWFRHGERLDYDALWSIYCRDGFHYLEMAEPSILVCEQIVCRVENQAGYVQSVVLLKKDGEEVYCEPVLPPVTVETEEQSIAPVLELDISETSTDNLRQYSVSGRHADQWNYVSLEGGERVQVLGRTDAGSVLARQVDDVSKICYVPQDLLVYMRSADAGVQECSSEENARSEINTAKDKQEVSDSKNTETKDKMPERRKMKSPSPKMTSTPKMKRKGHDRDSPTELQARLGLKDAQDSQKGVSYDDMDYNDGTTRPMFKKRLRNQTANGGEKAQLECVVSGTPLPKVLWLKNNRPLKAADGCKVFTDEETNILEFPAAKDDDVGVYTARAMNVNGSVTSSAEFTLKEGVGLPAQTTSDGIMDLDFTTPAYFFQMSSCEVGEGRLARFDCRVVAYPRPEIVWMRDGKVVESGDRFKLLNFNNEIYSLLIQDVKLTDTGRYTCWARNKFGEAMTEAYLNVIALSEQPDDGDIAPKFLTRFYDQQTAEGTPSDFKCLIAGRPEPSVIWLHENMELRDAPGTRIRQKDGMVSLEIKSPKVDQSGEYTCQLSNTLGDATCSARLTVVEDKLHGKMLPKFIKKFDHINAKEGEEVQFKCVIVGEPKPEVSWLMDHKPISDTNRRYVVKRDGDVYTLTIKDARFDDTCTVTCKAVNSEGESYCSANLHIRESKYITDVAEKAGRKMEDQLDSKFGYVPTFTKRLQDTEVTEGARARFECKVMGIPEPEVAWMKDGRVIVPGGRYHMTREGGTCQLTIDNVSSTDTGVYTCIISNNQGKSSSTAELKLEGVKKERYTPERFLDDRVKKERYTPERFLDDKISKRERYTPDKYLLDDSTPVKRPYLDKDLIDVKPRRSYESPALPKPYEPRKSYEPPALPPTKTYDDTSARSRRSRYSRPLSGPISLSFDDTITPTTSLPTRSFETPLTKYDDTSLTRPRVRFSTPPLSKHYDLTSSLPSHRYESPSSRYDDISTTYKRRSYESPLGWFDDSSVTIPKRAYESYESPVRAKEPEMKVAPKIPYDRPTILNKREDSVRLSWLPAPTHGLPIDAQRISYVVESREVPGKEWTKIATSVPMTSYLVRHLRPDKEYEFRVRAQNQHGVSEPTWSAPLEKRVDDSRRFADLPEMRAPPRLPTHRPIITDLGEETVRLAWRPAETYQAKRAPPVSYRLEARELPGKDWMPLSSRLRDTSHYLSELPLDRDYMIRVRAENDFGISDPTDSLWLPRARAFPGVPVSRPEIVDLEATRAKLSWTRVDIPTFGLDDTQLMYMLEVEEPSQDWRTIARDLDDTEYIVEGLKPDLDYRFRVRAKTPAGVVSEPSPATSLYTALARSRAPVDRLEVTGYEPDTRSLNLSWQRVEIPPYNREEEPLMYMLEYQEPPLPDWRPLVTGVPTTRYRVMHIDPERDYNFRVRALTPYGVSPPSPALPVSLRHGPVSQPLPEAVIISEVESDSLRLTWRRPMTDLSQPISYRIEMLEPPMTEWVPIATGVTESTYKVKGLRPTKDYQFRVIPQISTRMLAASPAVGLTSAAVRPRLPISEPQLKELSPESVQLSWRPAELPVYQRSRVPLYYGVEMMEVPGTAWVPVARRVPDTTYNVTGLRPDRDYKFRVIAETDVGMSQPSLPTVLHRRPAPVFSTMEPAIKDISPNIVLLTWQPADIPSGSSPVSYRVEIQSPPGISTWNTLHAHHPTPSVRLADLRPDLDYLVRVRAHTDGYLSEPTLPVYIPRRAVPPRIPVEQPYAVEITPDYVKLQWRCADLPSNIGDYSPVTYRVEAQEQPGSDWTTVARGVPHTDFKVTGLNPAKDYAFRIRAENDYGVSDPTRSVTIRKRSVAPILPHDEPVLFDFGPGSVHLTWRPATLPSHLKTVSPISYTIFVQEHPFKTWRPLVRGIPHTSYYITGLNPDREYSFRIQADNEYGSSKPTEPVYMPIFKDIQRPISIPEVSDFDEDLTSVKLHWKPRAGSPFDRTPYKYQIETWEPVRRVWHPVARGVPETSYQLRDLPSVPAHLFRVRLDSEQAGLSEPSLPVSVSRYYRIPRVPVYRPQLYELDNDTVRLSWQSVTLPEGVTKRPVRYTIEQREIPDTRWTTVVPDVPDNNYRIKGLRAKSDYEFRVRAIIDGSASEPSPPVALYRRPVIPRVRFDAPEVYDVDDSSLSLSWNKVDVPAFSSYDEPLHFMIERQTLPGYEWSPVATGLTDTSYRVRDLKPYQDYNFRVRGVYPSGYTDPSPYVPVYRRPSESKLGVLGIDSSLVVSGSQIAKTSTNQILPTQSLRSSVPSEYSSAIRSSKQSRLTRSHASSPQRKYSNIYDSVDKLLTEAPFVPPQAKFKLEDAYVYQRPATLVTKIPTKFETMLAEVEARTTERRHERHEKKKDLYDMCRLWRRHSDAGLHEISRSQEWSRSQERVADERRQRLILESQRKPERRSSSASTIPTLPRATESTSEYVSVADRYEDIKCPHIMRPGKWTFPRRRSISLDQQDLDGLRHMRHDSLAGLVTRTICAPKTTKHTHSNLDQSYYTRPAEYNDGAYFIIEDEVKLDSNRVLPRVSRVDMRTPLFQRECSPGYFRISKFSLTVSGYQKPTEKYVRPISTDPAPVLRKPPRVPKSTRSATPDLHQYRERSRSQSISQMQSVAEWQALKKTISQSLDKVESKERQYKSKSRTSADRSLRSESVSVSRQSPMSKYDNLPATRPRSNSISVVRGDHKFNRLVENSKDLINNYQTLDRKSQDRLDHSYVGYRSRTASVSGIDDRSKYRSPSVSSVKHDPRFSSTPRSSVADVKSDPRYTSTPRSSAADALSGYGSRKSSQISITLAKPTVHTDVKSDPRFTSHPRGSLPAMSSIKEARADVMSDPRFTTQPRGSLSMHSRGDIKSDPRFSTRRRATVSSEENADLRLKLDSLNAQLAAAKPKKKKSSRPVMKFKSSHGEGYLMDDVTWSPRSERMQDMYHKLS